MDTYTSLYLFVKLDDIRSCLVNDYELVTLLVLLSVLVVPVAGRILKSTGGMENRWQLPAKIWAALFVFTFCISFVFNTVATFLPSTGQMAAIYLGGKAAESDTSDILAKLPAKYATLLDQKANEWLEAQLPTEKEAEGGQNHE